MLLTTLKDRVGNLSTPRTNELQKSVVVHHEVVEAYPREAQKQILDALHEAWNWLETSGLVAQREGSPHETFFITRRGS
ncbi:MAG: hypothetical protein M3Q07_13155 [Pseudobdellovibrionaceae bacterium]|nr:hypothetical protein [Pseudobdellovibrionaceae bacterium]